MFRHAVGWQSRAWTAHNWAAPGPLRAPSPARQQGLVQSFQHSALRRINVLYQIHVQPVLSKGVLGAVANAVLCARQMCPVWRILFHVLLLLVLTNHAVFLHHAAFRCFVRRHPIRMPRRVVSMPPVRSSSPPLRKARTAAAQAQSPDALTQKSSHVFARSIATAAQWRGISPALSWHRQHVIRVVLKALSSQILIAVPSNLTQAVQTMTCPNVFAVLIHTVAANPGIKRVLTS